MTELLTIFFMTKLKQVEHSDEKQVDLKCYFSPGGKHRNSQKKWMKNEWLYSFMLTVCDVSAPSSMRSVNNEHHSHSDWNTVILMHVLLLTGSVKLFRTWVKASVHCFLEEIRSDRTEPGKRSSVVRQISAHQVFFTGEKKGTLEMDVCSINMLKASLKKSWKQLETLGFLFLHLTVQTSCI